MESRRQEIISSIKSDIDLINSARLGNSDYDFESMTLISDGFFKFFSIKSKKDGKRYAAKRLLGVFLEF